MTHYDSIIKEIELSEKAIEEILGYAKKGQKITAEMVKDKAGRKEDLADLVIKMTNRVIKSVHLMKQSVSKIDELKDETVAAKTDVIKLQKDLIECKNDQIENFRNSVKSTLQTEFKSYSQAVSKGTGESLTARNIRTVVKDAVRNVTAGDERKKNVIIFGLMEENEETISKSVESVLLAIDQKPKFEAVRFGKDKSRRPVRVTLSGMNAVHDVLKVAKNLKTTTDYKDVYICPDLSPEDRAERKKLVGELKKKVHTNPGTYYFIKGGVVCSKQSETDEVSYEEETDDIFRCIKTRF